MVRYLFYTIGDLTYQSPLVVSIMIHMEELPQLSLLILPVVAQNVTAIRNFKFQISRRVSKLSKNQPCVKPFLMLTY